MSLVASTADGIVTRALTGHVTAGMTEHYSTVGFDEKRAAVAGVLSLVSLPKTGDRTGDGARNEKGHPEEHLQVTVFPDLF